MRHKLEKGCGYRIIGKDIIDVTVEQAPIKVISDVATIINSCN